MIKKIEEKLTENTSIKIMATIVVNMIINGIGFFSALINILIPAEIINKDTPTLMPLKALAITSISRRLLKNKEIKKMITKDGRITPSVANKDPKKPATLYPIKVAEFIAIGPGVDSASATQFKNSSLVIHFFFSIHSFSISEIIAYPPPKVNSPILKNVRNNFSAFLNLSINCYYKGAKYICQIIKNL